MRVVINGDNGLSLNNRAKFFKRLKLDSSDMVACDLVHGIKIKTVTKKDAGKIIIATDGLVTKEKNLILTVTAADCLPLYFFDQKQQVIGIAHAGWRGVWQNLAGEMVLKMKKQFHCLPENFNVYIGPHIKKCHFDINPELSAQFEKYKKFLFNNSKSIKIDLSGIVRQQLIEAGIKKANIKVSPDCTYCHKKYFSNRRDKPKVVEAMMGYIILGR